MSIRGLAGPYVIMGNNFAPGTTAADIQSAMEPVGGEMQSCRIVSASPTVIAEMTFTDKNGAENVVATFNNQKADGRLLYIYMKQGPAARTFPSTIDTTATANRPPTEPRAARLDMLRSSRPEDSPIVPSYDSSRDHAGRSSRRADPEYQDGSYGFEERQGEMEVETDNRQENHYDDRRHGRQDDVQGRNMNQRRDTRRDGDDRGLYSDTMYPKLRGRGFR